MVLTFPQVTPKNQDPPGLVVPHWSSLFVLFHWPWLFIDTAWLANHSTPPRQRGDWPRLTEYARDTDYSFQILQITVSKYCRLQFPDIADYNFQIFQITCCQDPNSTTTQTQPQLLLDFIKKKLHWKLPQPTPSQITTLCFLQQNTTKSRKNNNNQKLG